MKKQKFSQLRTAISISLVLLMVLSLCPISAFAVSDEPYVPEYFDNDTVEFIDSRDGLWYYWVLSDGKSIEIFPNFEVGNDNEFFELCIKDSDIVIPSTIDGYTVVQIGCTAFDNQIFDCYFIESVTIPDTVKYIGEYAFYGCTALTDIYIPDSVTSIRIGAIPARATIHAPHGSFAEYWAGFNGNPVDNNMEIPTEPEEILGDINGDGEVTLDDYAVLKNYLSGVTVYGLDYSAFDVNGDGAVDGFDLFYINRYINCGTPYDA